MPNKHLYNKIVQGMAEVGYKRTGVQCRDKLKNLKSNYRKVKDSRSKKGIKKEGLEFNCYSKTLHNKTVTQKVIITDNEYLGIVYTVLVKESNRTEASPTEK